MREIYRIYPNLNKEEIKQLIIKYPELKDAIMSSYINHFMKQGNIQNNIGDINDVFNINMRHQPKKYDVPIIEKIKKLPTKITKPTDIEDYENFVPNNYKTIF